MHGDYARKSVSETPNPLISWGRLFQGNGPRRARCLSRWRQSREHSCIGFGRFRQELFAKKESKLVACCTRGRTFLSNFADEFSVNFSQKSSMQLSRRCYKFFVILSSIGLSDSASRDHDSSLNWQSQPAVFIPRVQCLCALCPGSNRPPVDQRKILLRASVYI
jgi:hypothetical protein